MNLLHVNVLCVCMCIALSAHNFLPICCVIRYAANWQKRNLFDCSTPDRVISIDPLWNDDDLPPLKFKMKTTSNTNKREREISDQTHRNELFLQCMHDYKHTTTGVVFS